MLSQPFFKVGEINCTRLLQRARCEPTHPAIGNPQMSGYFPVASDSRFNSFSCFFYSFFNIHVDTIVTTDAL